STCEQACDGGLGCRTITVLPPDQAWQTQIGLHTHLSAGDIAGLRQLYGEPDCPRPWIRRHPGYVPPVDSGNPATLSIALDDPGTAGPVSVQWRRDGVPLTDNDRIHGSASPTLTITAALAADAGTYDAVLTNACGSLASDQATLNILCRADYDGDGA